MDARNRATDRCDTEFAQENREKPATASAATGSAGSLPVTAGRSRGVVPPSSSLLQYEADPAGHRVVVRHGDGRIAFAFGGYGQGPGQFDTPLDAVTVSPEFLGEPHGPRAGLSILTPWVAVADYGNRRIQFFECDGAYVGEIELEHTQAPCGLAWRAPALDVATPDGRTARVHVAAGLLATTGRDRHHAAADVRDARRALRVC